MFVLQFKGGKVQKKITLSNVSLQSKLLLSKKMSTTNLPGVKDRMMSAGENCTESCTPQFQSICVEMGDPLMEFCGEP